MRKDATRETLLMVGHTNWKLARARPGQQGGGVARITVEAG